MIQLKYKEGGWKKLGKGWIVLREKRVQLFDARRELKTCNIHVTFAILSVNFANYAIFFSRKTRVRHRAGLPPYFYHSFQFKSIFQSGRYRGSNSYLLINTTFSQNDIHIDL